MSEIFTCDDKDTLVAYLYGEVDVPTRKRVDDHLRGCAACADEVGALRSVRGELAAWAEPEPQLGFTIVRSDAVPDAAASDAASATVLRPARWWPAAVPAWAQAVAAVLVMAVGLAIANVQVRYDANGLAISTGWMTPAAAVGPAAPVADGRNMSAPPEAWQPALDSLATQLRSELRQRDTAVTPVNGIRTTSENDVLIRRVEALIAQSEQRQQQELAKRMMQVGHDFEQQRRADLMRINSVFDGFRGQTGEVQRNQVQMMDYIRRVSQPQQ